MGTRSSQFARLASIHSVFMAVDFCCSRAVVRGPWESSGRASPASIRSASRGQSLDPGPLQLELVIRRVYDIDATPHCPGQHLPVERDEVDALGKLAHGG